MRNKIPHFVKKVLLSLEESGFQAHCVGGCVRDLLMDTVPDDWDVTTSAMPQQVMDLFGDCAIPTGLKHGTVTVQMDGERVEVTTHRKDGAYHDSRHPSSVSFEASLDEDLQRRDFTVNSMAMDIHGAIYDPLGGQNDIENRLIRCVGNPEERFTEDALRMMRCLRFSSVLDFSIHEETAKAVHSLRQNLSYVAVERLVVEMTKMLCGDNIYRVLQEYHDVLGVFIPEILPMVGLDQRNRHHCYDVWEHTIRTVAFIPPVAVLRYTMLFHDMGKPRTYTLDEGGNGHFYGHPKVSSKMAQDVMERLKFDHDTKDKVTVLVLWHDRDIPRTRQGMLKNLSLMGKERLEELLLVKAADGSAKHPNYRAKPSEYLRNMEILQTVLMDGSCYHVSHLAVSGRDLQQMGKRGREIGDGLQLLLKLVMENQLPNERNALLGYFG